MYSDEDEDDDRFDSEQEQDDWDEFQCKQKNETQQKLLEIYTSELNSTILHTGIYNIDQNILKHHRIIMNHNTNLEAMLNAYEEDCYMTIKKKQHYGTHCLYDVVLGNFSLEINLLNLHRSSDDKDASITLTQLGRGGFGSVRSVMVGNNVFAVKRINFFKKIDTLNGFDFELQNAQYRQIRKAIREYCIYKICSMYKIGPEIIFRNNYDLVCYNNCLQFFMEQCLIPNKNPIFIKQKGLTISKLKVDLMQNLKVLHSLKMVHKDIKPDNILYSQSMNRFLFTDFGLTHAVKQNSNQKSLTSYAGTMDYWSPQMMEVYRDETRKGYVNLYLNDFYGLRLTMAKLQKQAKKSNNLSRSKMSYEQSQSINRVSFGSSLQKRQHDDEDQYETLFSHQSSSLSNNQKTLNNIYLTSTTSLDAPIKYASQINFYESIILYQLLKIKEVQLTLSPQIIKAKIQQECRDVQSNFIYREVERYTKQIFYPTSRSQENQLNNISLQIMSLKNSARNSGPKSQQTIQQLQKIINQSKSFQDHEIYNYFIKLKDDIINNKNYLQLTKLSNEIRIHLYLKNYHYLICSCIRVMREMILCKNQKQQNVLSQDNLMFACKIYIICNMTGAMNSTQVNIMNSLFIQLWDYQQTEDLTQFVNKYSQKIMNMNYSFKQNPYTLKIIGKLIKFACDYIIQHKEEHYMEIFFAFQFYSKHNRDIDSKDYQFYLSWVQKYFQNLNAEKQTVGKNVHSSLSKKVQLTKIYRKLFRNEKQNLEESIFLVKVKKIVDQLFQQQDKKFYFGSALQLISMYSDKDMNQDKILQLSLKLVEQIEIFKCSQIQKRVVLVRTNKIIGDVYLRKQQYQTSLYYLKLSQKYIVDYYGEENSINGYFDCRNNIAVAYYKMHKYNEALQIYEKLLDFIYQTNMIVVAQKALLYRCIVTIKLSIGITKQQYREIDKLVKHIVYQTIYTIITVCSNASIVMQQQLNIQSFNFINISPVLQHKIMIRKSILKHIQDHMQYFKLPYYKLNYQLYKIYLHSSQPSKRLRYVWNYIKIKMYDRKAEEKDFRLMNTFICDLIQLKLHHRALLIINKYIFRIPLQFISERKKAYELLHQIHVVLRHPFQRITKVLTENDCQALMTCNFSEMYNSTSPKRYYILNNLLLEKWQRKI